MCLDIPDLLINVWEYNDLEYKNCEICIQYEKWCIEALQSMWQPEFCYLDFVIKQISVQNKTFCVPNKTFFNFGNCSSEEKHLIFLSYMIHCSFLD